MMIRLELTEEEAEWVHACLGLVMQIARHWDNRTAYDVGNRLLAKLSLARVLQQSAREQDEDFHLD